MQTRTEQQQPALVVGAGIAGAAVAAFLRRVGREVRLFERRRREDLAEGAFLGLAPNGVQVLRELGVAEALYEKGHPCSGFQFQNHKGHPIGSIDRSRDTERFGAPLTMVRRADLYALLQDCAERAGVGVEYGRRLTAVETSTGGGLAARFEDGTRAEGSFLLGCDGLRSATRALVFPRARPPVFSGLLDVGGFVRGVDAPFAPGVNGMVFGKRAFFGVFTTPDGETWWFHNGPPPERGGLPRDTRAWLLELHREDPPWIAKAIEATEQLLGPWPLHEVRSLRRWSEGRVCLLGDAAHAMSPSAGQGAALALEDALELGKCLRDLSTPEEAFSVFERRRRPRVDAIAAQARRNGSGKAPRTAIARAFRDWLLPKVLPYGEEAQSRAYAFRSDWSESASAP